MNKKKLTITDFSSLYYSVCFNVSKSEDTDNFTKYKETLDYYVHSINLDTDADKTLYIGDGFTSFRKEEFKEFKQDRNSTVQMKFLKELKEYAEDKYKIVKSNVFEADDLCLIYHNHYKDIYDITIASKDSDLRQYAAKFYNYGWRRLLYSKGKVPDEIDLEVGFTNANEIISLEQAERNLWESVLIKGHNNKYHYLNTCGEVTAKSYLSTFKLEHLKLAVLNAFIYGIDNTKHTHVKRSVKGYNLIKGIDYYSKAFRQTYLLHTIEEAKLLDENFDIIEI